MKTTRFRLAAGLGLAMLAFGLTPAAHAQTPVVVSPEVTHTGTAPTGYAVTFRISDPTATRMRIRGEWFFSGGNDTTLTSSAGRLPSDWRVGDFPIANPNSGAAANWPIADMVKDADGVWSYTTPMPSGSFTYGFYRNCDATTPSLPGCTEISDPSNPPFNLVGGVNQGAVEPTSQVYVPSDPAFGTRDLSQEAPNPVHGNLVDLTYDDPESTSPPGQHYVAVYTPPGYDPSRALAYPTLFISHGGGGNEVDWFTQGVANRIVDNLLAAGRMQPAVVVATNFNGLPGGNPGYRFDLLNRVIPFIESRYNVSHNASDRAFAGLSLGGSRANELIFNATTSFGYYATWSIGTNGAPPAGDVRYTNADLKKLLGLVVGGGRFDTLTMNTKGTLEQRLADNGVPFTDDTIDGGHEWYVWRILLNHFAGAVAFRATRTTVVPGAGSLAVSVSPATAEPAVPTGTVQAFSGATPLGSPVALAGARATLPVANANDVRVVYSGDALYNTSSSEKFSASTIGGTVPAQLSLTLGPAASFGAFTAGVDKTYTAQTSATVTSTAGDAALTVSPATLANGTFKLAEPVAVTPAKTTWNGPVSNDMFAIAFAQHVGANDPLRTGTYSATLTFTLSTATP